MPQFSVDSRTLDNVIGYINNVRNKEQAYK